MGERNKISECVDRSIRENDSEIFKNDRLIESKSHEYCVAFHHLCDR